MPNIGRLSVVLLATCLGLIGTAGALADTQTKLLGDDRGTEFASTCDPGEALTGVRYHYTTMLSGITAVCNAVGPDGLTGKVRQTSLMYGPDSAYPPDAQNFLFCREPMAVKGLEVFFGDNLVVQSIRLSCHVPVGSKIGEIGHRTEVNPGADDSTTSKMVSCPSGMHATGFTGTYTGGIHSIGLTCHDFSASADVPTPDGDGGDGGLLVQTGPDGLDFRPKGRSLPLGEASTVYSDKGQTPVDYLDEGDKVVAIYCEDQGAGWCQIIKPTAGLIWGGDLDR